MIITKKAIPRRTVLRGIGATIALPLLDSMVPAAKALAQTPAAPTTDEAVMIVTRKRFKVMGRTASHDTCRPGPPGFPALARVSGRDVNAASQPQP